jgi:sugar lactone lactonase YvrE
MQKRQLWEIARPTPRSPSTTAASSRAPATAERAVNFAFGGPDLKTLFCCAHTSVYTLRVKVPGNPHPWYKLRGQ